MNRVMKTMQFSLLRILSRLCLAVGLACGFVGCGTTANSTTSAGTSDKEHAPATFAEALAQLATQKTNIQGAFEKSDPESAHDDLHTIGHLLESLPALAKKSGIAEADMPAVKEAVDALFDAFGKLDETLHGGDETPYKDVSEKIDTALSALNKMTAK